MLRSLIASVAAACLLSAAGAAQGAIHVYTANMSGLNEVPANASTAFGFTSVTVDDFLNTMRVDISWSGLTATPAAAHIHCCAPVGVNAIVAVGFPGFPATLSGAYSHDFNLLDSAIYTAGFLTAGGGTVAGAEARLLNGFATGVTYSNIHNTVFGGGEIRGQLIDSGVPEPAAWAMMILGFGAVGATLRRRRPAFG